MNRKQLIAIWVGVVALVIAGAFPPFTMDRSGAHREKLFAPIWKIGARYHDYRQAPFYGIHDIDSKGGREWYVGYPNWYGLIWELATIVLITGTAIVTFRDRHPK